MKPLSILIFASILCGCAENRPPADEVREHFERGLSGQGHIVPLGNPEDPAAPSGQPQ
jgi:hypothetical protein